MNTRKEFENREKRIISNFGCLSSQSKGRKIEESPCQIRTNFQVDRDRIVYSNAFRRLKHKTQVFLNPTGDEYRTRLTHTLEVAQIARTISRALSLNEDLTEAIALGHDLGHTPFGHGGETILKEIHSSNFSHDKQGLRIVQKIENNGKGLNLTHEVLDGILKHSKGYGKIIPTKPSEAACTIEGQVVRISDIMAYINHDLDDAVRSGVILAEKLPAFCVKTIGSTHQQRAIAMIEDVISSSSAESGNLVLRLSDNMMKAMTMLREFLYENVYRSEKVHHEFVKAKKILSELYAHFIEYEEELYLEMGKIGIRSCADSNNHHAQTVCDFIASITDRYALNLYKKIFFPTPTV